MSKRWERDEKPSKPSQPEARSDAAVGWLGLVRRGGVGVGMGTPCTCYAMLGSSPDSTEGTERRTTQDSASS